MVNKILNFIKYNNAFTIIFVLLFFSFGVSYAANPAVQEAIYKGEETIISIDNSRIVSIDLDTFNFDLRINDITEDENDYYATYSYKTLVMADGAWQDREIEKTLTVNKETLDGKDLGLYIARELGENINYELSYLKRVQKLEREKGESQKIVATEYSGLIGKLLNPKEEVIEGYTPVVPEIVSDIPATPESNPAAVIVSLPREETTEATPQPRESSEPAQTSTLREEVTRQEQSSTSTTSSSTTASTSTETSTATSTPVQVQNQSGNVETSTSTQTESSSSSTTTVATPSTESQESAVATSTPPDNVSPTIDASTPQQDGPPNTEQGSDDTEPPTTQSDDLIDEELVQEVVQQMLEDNEVPVTDGQTQEEVGPAPEAI